MAEGVQRGAALDKHVAALPTILACRSSADERERAVTACPGAVG
eukprot:CAMPEP_0182548162 /NCGR_PEP_ID=MMETSP1323-20130603/38434_1 /TAXON_ID=236787 /ORGANISM="Florenciella parvula, Strain RCC1693" /LENGTH=43 /DNA_ID= /DNA_START= /DNA_END= /DNA_ORIENTATION=